MWWVYALLSALFASLTAIFAKLGVEEVPSNLATAVRTVVILLLVWGIVFAKGEQKALGSLPRQAVLFLIVSGLATGLSWLFYFKALQIGDVSKVAPVDKLSVALTILLSALFLKEAVTLRTLGGAALILVGTLVIAWK
jgi:transporter family protein